jgi:alpha-tubulin suppressor-like RCC1 family protein
MSMGGEAGSAGAWAWGANEQGQLGTGSVAGGSALPIRPVLPDTPRALSAGGNHSLALLPDGRVWAWGWNLQGQLGNDLGEQVPTATRVEGLDQVTAISAGDTHSLALRADGSVWAWGNNEDGRLGDGTTEMRRTPVPVVGLGNITAISAGLSHNLALRGDGTVWAWGANPVGGLGDGTTISRHIPVQVSGIGDATAIAAGGLYSLARLSDGTLRAWGWNARGQLGDGSFVDRYTPVQVMGLTQVTRIAAGGHVLALRQNGSLWAWGWNIRGQLGTGSTDPFVPTAAPVIGIGDATEIAAGLLHSHARRSDGSLWSWGGNDDGVLGDGTEIDRPLPVPAQVIAELEAISTSASHSLAIAREAPEPNRPPVLQVPAQQVAHHGQPLTLTLSAVDPNPGDVLSYRLDAASLAKGLSIDASSGAIRWTPSGAQAGVHLVVATVSDDGSPMLSDTARFAIHVHAPPGKVVAFGRNDGGALGDGSRVDRALPVAVQDLPERAIAVATGANHSLALLDDGSVWSWGRNLNGQLGDGSQKDRLQAAPIPKLSEIVSIAAFEDSSFAIDRSGNAWAWGSNREGHLGDGTLDDRLAPIPPQGLPPILQLHAGIALDLDGRVWTWGSNLKGELGDGSTAPRLLPAAIPGVDDIIGISRGAFHKIVQRADGSLASWGHGALGRLGNGNVLPQFSPASVLSIQTALAVSSGYGHSLARLADGSLRAWGSNFRAELGHGGPAQNFQVTPVTVASMDTGVEDVAAGFEFTLARVGSRAYAWGDNVHGQLGDGSFALRPLPVEIRALSAVGALTTGAFSKHSLAIVGDPIFRTGFED